MTKEEIENLKNMTEEEKIKWAKEFKKEHEAKKKREKDDDIFERFSNYLVGIGAIIVGVSMWFVVEGVHWGWPSFLVGCGLFQLYYESVRKSKD